MAEEVQHDIGGISGLREFLREHTGAVNFDLMAKGYTVRDIGPRLSWSDFKDFIEWLPPTGESALWRARRPRSWWVTPEIQWLSSLVHVLELANWQRAGGKKAGPAPKPYKFPEDKDHKVKSDDQLLDKRKEQSEHLKRRRAQRSREQG